MKTLSMEKNKSITDVILLLNIEDFTIIKIKLKFVTTVLYKGYSHKLEKYPNFCSKQ